MNPGGQGTHVRPKVRCTVLYWALVFFIIAIVAAVFGFGGIAAGAMGVAKVLFFIFLVLFVVSLLAGLLRGGRGRLP